MNLSKQITQLRKRDNLSQEKLAEKLYVSRQSISNWENERSYPDIHNLLMMSVLFDVSLDTLVKGDVDFMKAELQKSTFMKWTYIMLALMIAVPVSIAPVLYFFGYNGLFISLLLSILLMIAAFKIENIKKKYNLRTYRQIINFVEGKPVNKVKPGKKDAIFKVVLMLVSAVFSFIVAYLGMTVFGL